MNIIRRNAPVVLIAGMLLGTVLLNEGKAVVQATLKVTPEIISSLKLFREEPKFEDAGIYHAPSEAIRAESARHLN